MPITKTCTECHKEYEATSPNQKLCHSCKNGESYTDPEPVAPTKANVRIIEHLSNAVTLQSMAQDLLNISGCKCLLLDYDEISIKIDRK